jgi:hypothetical protein
VGRLIAVPERPIKGQAGGAGEPIASVVVEPPIRLMPEYGAPPLWTERGPVTPEQLGLSPQLTAAIWAWEYEYDHEGPNHGRWPDDTAYGIEGQRLAALVAEELGCAVEYEP